MTKPNGWEVGKHWLQQVTDINLVKNEVYRLEQEELRKSEKQEKNVWDIIKTER